MPVSDFYKTNRSLDGYAWRCIPCSRAYYLANVAHYARLSKRRYERNRVELLALKRDEYSEEAAAVSLKRAIKRKKATTKPYRSKHNPEVLTVEERMRRV